jgi:hypothetical protein
MGAVSEQRPKVGLVAAKLAPRVGGAVSGKGHQGFGVAHALGLLDVDLLNPVV